MDFFSFNIYSFLFLLSVLISFILILISWKNRKNDSGIYFFFLISSVFIWSLFSFLEILSLSFGYKFLFSQLSYLGIAFLPVFILMFSLHFNGFTKIIKSSFFYLLFLIPVITLVLVFTTKTNGLIWQNVFIGEEVLFGARPLIYNYGSWYRFVHIPFSYSLITLAIALFIRSFFVFGRKYLKQSIAILIGFSFPFLINIIYVFGFSPLAGIDITVLAFALAGILFALAIFRGKILDLLPVARNLIIERMLEGVLVVDKSNRIIDANPLAREIIKIDHHFFGKNIKEIFPYWNKIEKIIKKDGLGTIFIKERSMYLNVYVNLLDGHGDRNSAYLIIFQDITNQKKLQESLEKSENDFKNLFYRFKLAIEAAEIGVWELDLKTQKLIWDDQMYKIYEVDKNKFKNNRSAWEKLIHPEDLDKVNIECRRSIDFGTHLDSSFRIVCSSGREKYINSFAQPFRDEKGFPAKMIGINIDVTKEKENELAKSEFISLASHQLRTPLTSMNWYTELLLSGDTGELNVRQKQYLQEISSGNQYMTNLVNLLLNISRIETGTFVVELNQIDLVSVSKKIIKSQDSIIKDKKIKLTSKFGKNIPKIKADEKLFSLILHIIISNAISYTDEGGKISLETYLDPTEKNIIFKVSDNGCGIPEEQQDKIFSKLFRASNVKEKNVSGVGVSLHLVKAILDYVEGKIWFDSVVDKGSNFYFSLPITGMKKKERIRKII